jgi:uncharacterized protein YyaL (SSP411 family)
MSRENRTKPFKDKKILLDLNAMTITALLKGYDVLAVKDYLDIAKKAMAFLLKNLKIKTVFFIIASWTTN